MPLSPTAYTVGHGNRTLDELATVLRSAGVGRLVDVRRYPASRRHPHFSQPALEAELPALGVEYAWRGEELGGRRRPLDPISTRHPGWDHDAFRGYADFTDSAPYRAAVERLAAEAEDDPPLAFKCAETLWWRCHRRLIADSLTTRGVAVVHLLDVGKIQRHAPPPMMRVGEDGWPVYDVGVDRPLL
jgi:uncharacterized protein (DUF488 family)